METLQMNRWKLATVLVITLFIGYLIGQGTGLINAQTGGVMKVQLDTSNCSFGVGASYAVPSGAMVFYADAGQYSNTYVYTICE